MTTNAEQTNRVGNTLMSKFQFTVDFCQNQAYLSHLPLAPPSSLSLTLYGRAKQVMKGDCNTPQPSIWSIKERLKWNAWHELIGVNKWTALDEYMDTLKQYVSELDTSRLSPEGQNLAHKLLDACTLTAQEMLFIRNSGVCYDYSDENDVIDHQQGSESPENGPNHIYNLTQQNNSLDVTYDLISQKHDENDRIDRESDEKQPEIVPKQEQNEINDTTQHAQNTENSSYKSFTPGEIIGKQIYTTDQVYSIPDPSPNDISELSGSSQLSSIQHSITPTHILSTQNTPEINDLSHKLPQNYISDELPSNNSNLSQYVPETPTKPHTMNIVRHKPRSSRKSICTLPNFHQTPVKSQNLTNTAPSTFTMTTTNQIPTKIEQNRQNEPKPTDFVPNINAQNYTPETLDNSKELPVNNMKDIFLQLHEHAVSTKNKQMFLLLSLIDQRETIVHNKFINMKQHITEQGLQITALQATIEQLKESHEVFKNELNSTKNEIVTNHISPIIVELGNQHNSLQNNTNIIQTLRETVTEQITHCLTVFEYHYPSKGWPWWRKKIGGVIKRLLRVYTFWATLVAIYKLQKWVKSTQFFHQYFRLPYHQFFSPRKF